MSTAAIFGASGGIGRALTEELAEQGYRVWAGSRSGLAPSAPGIISFAFDLHDEPSIAAAARMMESDPPQMIIVATGALTLADGTGPERSFRKLDPSVMAQVLATNTIGPAIVAKHMLPLLPRDSRGIFAALSARVGSIGDNRLGGWHSYRASKAALNMLVRNFAIELARSHKHAVVVGLHPGTVDSALSKPFQSNVPSTKLFTPELSAERLVGVLYGLTPAESGGVFAYDGEPLPA
ncbi:MAG: SDR family NAD(P)-dependent oxidoreductase [Pontixanthobacter sp.]